MIPFHCVSTAIQQIQRILHSMHTFSFHLFCDKRLQAVTASTASATAGGFWALKLFYMQLYFFIYFCFCVPFAFAHTRLQLDCNWIILLTTKRCAFYLFQATAALPQFLTPTHTLIQIWNAPKTRLSRSLLTARMSDYRTLTKQCTVALTDCWTVS